MKNIAIIGAGMAGLCAARHSLAAGHRVTIFEQSNRLGGTWVYRDENRIDCHGLDVQSSVYNGLVTNLPKEIMSFPDIPYAEQTASYIAADDVLAYLDKFVERFQLHANIRFEHQVILVRPNGKTKPDESASSWAVTVHDLLTERYETTVFDAVFVCNGHTSVPFVPEYPGLAAFRDRVNVTHSLHYRQPEPFAGRTVLIVGAGASGFDLSAAIGPLAKRLAMSSRRSIPGHFAPAALMRPAVERFTADGAVVFADGTTERFTDVVFCTGYRHSFPFVSMECGLRLEAEAYVRTLFKECINIERPTMFVLGVHVRYNAFPIVDLQARFCLAFLDGRRALPTRSEMLSITEADMEQRLDKYGSNVRQMHRLEPFQEQYQADLAQLAGLEPIKPVILAIYKESFRYLFEKGFQQFWQQRFRVLNDVEFEQTVDEEGKYLWGFLDGNLKREIFKTE